MGRTKLTARKSTGGPTPRLTSQTTTDIEIIDSRESNSLPAVPSRGIVSSMSITNNVKSSKGSDHQSIKPSPDVTPMELQIRQVELMEEQCDSLEKLVEIASERRDIEREILEIKKRKLAILEKNNKK